MTERGEKGRFITLRPDESPAEENGKSPACFQEALAYNPDVPEAHCPCDT